MRILSNGFPTNLPNSEQVSQGGPANFAKAFFKYLQVENVHHEWIGVIFSGVNSHAVQLRKGVSVGRRKYFLLRTPRRMISKVLQASMRTDPKVVLREPISRLVNLIRKEKPDIVFLNGFGILNWMLLKAAEKTNTPVVIQHAGIWTKELRLHKEYYSVFGRKLMEKMERESTKIAQKEIFLNEWSKNYYQRNVARGASENAIVIPLPFNFSSFKTLQDVSKKKRFVFESNVVNVGVIARWDKIKNHKAVLTAAKYAKRNGLPLAFHSIVDIPNKKEYLRMEKEYERYVHVIGPQGRAKISEFCSAVDVLFLPSLFDVSPTVVLESIATDTPIVISPNVGYVSDFTSNGGSEWVMDTARAKNITESLIRLADKRMPTELIEKLIEKHDHQKVFGAYLAVFRSLIGFLGVYTDDTKLVKSPVRVEGSVSTPVGITPSK